MIRGNAALPCEGTLWRENSTAQASGPYLWDRGRAGLRMGLMAEMGSSTEMLRLSISRLLLRAKADATEAPLPRPPGARQTGEGGQCPLTDTNTCL